MRKGLLGRMITAGGCESRALWRRLRAHHTDSQWVYGRRVRGSDHAGQCGRRVRPPQPASQGFVRSHRTPGNLGDNEATNARLLEAVISPQQPRNLQSTSDCQAVSSSNSPHHLLKL